MCLLMFFLTYLISDIAVKNLSVVIFSLLLFVSLKQIDLAMKITIELSMV